MNNFLHRPVLVSLCVYFLCCIPVFALEPNEILIITNSDIASSGNIAQYYCTKRGVPPANILALPLGTVLNDTITRDNYEKQLAEPIRKKLSDYEFAVKIKCLLTTYGVPVRVERRGQLKDQEYKLKELKVLAEHEKSRIEQLKRNGINNTSREIKEVELKLAKLQTEIDFIVGRETNASVDSELSMVLCGDYELYRWQQNRLKGNLLDIYSNTLMVSRLDGPGPEIAKNLIDKAISAENTGLRGIAYIDARGIIDDKKSFSFGQFDQSLRDLASLVRVKTGMVVKEENTEKLFEAGTCPQTAIYCGWYSLKRYIDAFDFIDGAIGYHIASLEASDIHDPNSSQWCPAMLKDGITATLGAVNEPYIHSFPKPKDFFQELFNGRCLVEAYYYTNPCNSWQMVLIGDPLYTPFKNLERY